ncbi:hypothetical protein [Clavibacter tessellarius]|uniref:hypothetical protein n=1 Tax=Clavibacter tessellarius TaxID=31965 RepID=UPI003245ADE1
MMRPLPLVTAALLAVALLLPAQAATASVDPIPSPTPTAEPAPTPVPPRDQGPYQIYVTPFDGTIYEPRRRTEPARPQLRALAGRLRPPHAVHVLDRLCEVPLVVDRLRGHLLARRSGRLAVDPPRLQPVREGGLPVGPQRGLDRQHLHLQVGTSAEASSSRARTASTTS